MQIYAKNTRIIITFLYIKIQIYINRINKKLGSMGEGDNEDLEIFDEFLVLTLASVHWFLGEKGKDGVDSVVVNISVEV